MTEMEIRCNNVDRRVADQYQGDYSLQCLNVEKVEIKEYGAREIILRSY
jgi:hypothetical protein